MSHPLAVAYTVRVRPLCPNFAAARSRLVTSTGLGLRNRRMFGSTIPFGQSTNSPLGTPSAFGQTNNATNNPFAPKGFGNGSPFGSQTGTSMFGGTSTDVFEGTPFSSLAFGSSLFSTPALRMSMLGGTSTDCFEGTPFSSLAFGSSLYSTPALRTSSPAFGSSAFGAASTPAFGTGSSSSSLFSTPAFGTSVPAFGSSAFGAASTPAFGSGSSSSSLFSTPAFGTFSPAFGSSAFGAASTPAFGTGSSSFGGAQSTTPTFGSSGFGQQAFGGQRGGTRVVSYTPTFEVDGGSGTQPVGKLESITAMFAHNDKSHEELRWEDYQLGDKGGPNPASQRASGIGFGAQAQSSPFGTFGQPFADPFSSSTTSNPFAPETPNFGSLGFGASSSPAFHSSFGVTSSSPFGSTTSSYTPLFGPATTPAFGATSSTSLFGASSTPAFGASSSTLIFGSTSAGSIPAFGSALNFSNTQTTGLFQSSTPSLGQTSVFGSATPTFGQTTNSSFGQQNPFSTPSAGFGGNLFAGNLAPSLLNTSNPIGFGQTTIMGQERQHKNLVNLREREMESSPAATDSASTKESCVSSFFNPCHYLDLALKASLKCLGFDPDFTNSSTESEAAVGSSVVVPGADHALNSIHNIKAALPEICEAEAEQVKEVLPSTAV